MTDDIPNKLLGNILSDRNIICRLVSYLLLAIILVFICLPVASICVMLDMIRFLIIDSIAGLGALFVENFIKKKKGVKK